MTLSDSDRKILKRAKDILERPTLGVRLLGLVGSPIELGIEHLPAPVLQKVRQVSRAALDQCLRAAVSTLRGRRKPKPSRAFHISLAALSGGVGGMFGLPALAIELPISTMIAFRSIGQTARSMGEDLEVPETLVNCLEVFALGGRSRSDDAVETSYFAIRAALAHAVGEATAYLAARRTLSVQAAAPALVKLTEGIAARFGYAVSEKLVAASVPVVGALGGAAINAVFMDHFQNVAWGHFTVRALERKYDVATVREAWDRV